MEITQANLDILFRNAQIAFGEVLAQTPTWYQQVSTQFTSGTRQETYAWMDRIPRVREWLGDRIVNAVTTQGRVVENRVFEDTVALSKWDILDDQFGVFNMTTRYLADEAAKWPDTLHAQWFRDAAASVTSGGRPNLGYDGLPFFSASHPVQAGADSNAASVTGAATQSNLYTSRALTWDNYVYVRTQMASLVGADGLPLMVQPNLLIVPPALESIGKLILEADMVPSSAAMTTGTAGQSPMTNTYKGSAKLLVIPQLADKPNNWWLFDTTRVVKPILWQLRQPPVFTPRTNPADPVVFDAAQFVYGVDMRGNVSDTLWFLAAAATSAASY